LLFFAIGAPDRAELKDLVMEQAYLIARSIGEHGFALLQLDQIPAGHTGGGTEFQRDFPDDLCVHLSVPVIRRAFEPMFEIIRFQENVQCSIAPLEKWP